MPELTDEQLAERASLALEFMDSRFWREYFLPALDEWERVIVKDIREYEPIGHEPAAYQLIAFRERLSIISQLKQMPMEDIQAAQVAVDEGRRRREDADGLGETGLPLKRGDGDAEKVPS